MIRAFFFEFSFQDDQDRDDDEEKLFTIGFTLGKDHHALIHGSEWFGDTADELEEKYDAVHDFSGSGDETNPVQLVGVRDFRKGFLPISADVIV